MNRINLLDGLRGVFCIMILYEHYSPDFIPTAVYEFPLIRHSYIVVDFFFTLSGFILSMKYSRVIKSLTSLRDFFLKRFFRLYPLLILTSSISLIFELASNHWFMDIKNTPDSTDILIVRFINDILLINSSNFFGSFAMNVPSWSISSEFFCYLFFGFFVLIFYKFKMLNKVALGVSILTFMLLVVYLDAPFSTYNFGYIRGIFSFLVGVSIHLFSQNKKIYFSNYYQYIILGTFVFVCFLLSTEIPYISMMAALFLPYFFAFSILVLLNSNGFLTHFLNHKYITRIGEISFSVYLNHFLVVLIFPRVIFQILKFPNEVVYQMIVFLTCPTIVLFISFFTHKYIEVKLNLILRKLFLNQ